MSREFFSLEDLFMHNYDKDPIAILGMKSKSNQKIYTIVLWDDGISCNCPCGGIGGYCKHLKMALYNNPELLTEYSSDKKNELTQKLKEITCKISPNVYKIIEEVELLKSQSSYTFNDIKPLLKQIVKTSKHTVGEAFLQAKLIDKTVPNQKKFEKIVSLITLNSLSTEAKKFLKEELYKNYNNDDFAINVINKSLLTDKIQELVNVDILNIKNDNEFILSKLYSKKLILENNKIKQSLKNNGVNITKIKAGELRSYIFSYFPDFIDELVCDYTCIQLNPNLKDVKISLYRYLCTIIKDLNI